MKLIQTIAASAVLALSLLGGAAIAPALAIDPDVSVICWDMIDADGNEVTECDEVDDIKAECEVADPGNVSDMCQDVNKRPVRDLAEGAPQSLSSAGDGDDEPELLKAY